jgi:hypothetical protein
VRTAHPPHGLPMDAALVAELKGQMNYLTAVSRYEIHLGMMMETKVRTEAAEARISLGDS